jgi:hypothetical protein
VRLSMLMTVSCLRLQPRKTGMKNLRRRVLYPSETLTARRLNPNPSRSPTGLA